MEKLRKMLPYLLVIGLAFYSTPFFFVDTGSGMFLLLVAVPIICFVTSAIYAIKHRFHWLFPILAGLLFLPTVSIFYNDSALPYSWIYAVIVAAGSLLEHVVSKKK